MSKVVARNRSKSYGIPAQTREQLWAKQRNFSKFRLSGMRANFALLQGVLTPTEQSDINDIIGLLDKLLDKWDGNNAASKSNFLRFGGGK